MATRYDTSRFSGDVSALKLPANLLPPPAAAFNLIPIPVATIGQQQQPPPTETESNKWFWAWLIVGSLVLLVGILAIVSLHGERIEVGDRRKPAAAGADTAASCTLDEVFDQSAKMCIMEPHFPKAVADSIIDAGVAPCTDFYRHACGKWIDAHTNENRGFAGLSAVNGATVRSIVLDENIANLHPFFRSCEATLVDPQNRRKQRQQHGIETKLTRDAILGRMLDPLVTTDDLPIVFARMAAAGYTVPVALVIYGNPKGKGVFPMLTYDGFTAVADDRDYVRSHFEEMYGADGPQADQEALMLIDMVRRLNLARPDKNGVLESYAGWKEYVNSSAFDRDVVTWGVFKNVVCASSTFAWEAFIDELGRSLLLPDFHISNAQHVWAFSRSYFEWWQPELFSLQEWKTYITFSVLYHTHDFFPELPADVLLSSRGALRPINVVSPLRGGPHRRLKKMRLSSEAYGERRRRTSSAQQKRRRSSAAADGSVITVDDCVAATKYMLPGILSREFLKRQFPTDSGETIRGRITGMVERIRDRFVKNILATPWLDPETKRLQAEKIRAIIPRVVHPTQWTEEAFPLGREMDPARYLRNLNIIQEERVKRNLALWSESNYGAACDERCRDRITPFGSPLFTVNAWYNPDRNVMTVPGGILKPPFFHEQFTDASAYGTIGWVIAHELSHGEDANGILYDKDGALINTWTNETTLRKYISRFARVVKEYGSPAGCNHENYGMQTLSEDIADINGLRLAYEALFVDHPPPGSGVSDKKEFFMAAAQMWCASYTQEAMCDRSRDDVHAIAPYRVDKTFSHMPYFAEVYQCPAGSPMHRHVHERIVLFGEEAVDLSKRKK